MATTMSNSRQALAVLIVRDSLEDLNAALMRANIEPGDVVSISPIPRITPVSGDYDAKLQVIYRTWAPAKSEDVLRLTSRKHQSSWRL
jgi:hypothetical protein